MKNTVSLDEGGWRRTVEQGAEHLMAKLIVAENAKAGAGSLALVARTCILLAFGLQMPWRLFLALLLFCFTSFSSLYFHKSRGHSLHCPSV